jgi:hypothetical protein
MASFLVQARLSAKEQKERATLDRAQALRVNEEASAAKLLGRVQEQMAEFVYPVQLLSAYFIKAFERAAFECGCESYMATYAFEWFSPPTQPYATVMNVGNPETLKRMAANPFGHTLPREDLARLAADTTCCARWEELMVHTVLPPLRELMPVLQSKVRMNRGCLSTKTVCFTYCCINSCVDASCLAW